MFSQTLLEKKASFRHHQSISGVYSRCGPTLTDWLELRKAPPKLLYISLISHYYPLRQHTLSTLLHRLQ